MNDHSGARELTDGKRSGGLAEDGLGGHRAGVTRFLPFLLSVPLLANDTGINSGAHGPSPLGEFVGDESVIRMAEESIHIRFGKEESEVTCRFTFRSGKKEGDAKQVVGFPDFIDTETDTGSIREMQTFIDGRKVEAKKQRGWFFADE